MGNVGIFSAVNSKIHAMQKKLLKKEDFNKLIEANSFKDCISYLANNTGYKEAFPKGEINNLRRKDIEKYLKANYVKNFEKLAHYFSGDYKEVVKILFMRYEIEDLKIIIRSKYRDKTSDEIKEFIMYENSLSSFNYNDLIKEKDIAGVIQSLKNTKYFNHIYPLVKDIDEKGLFALETSLDFKYFSQIRDIVKRIDKSDADIIQKEIGTYIDLLNLQWIYRGMKFYKISKEELFNYIIYDGYKLNNKVLKELCYAESIEQFVEMLEGTAYGSIFKETKNIDYLLEREILNYIKNRYLKIYKTGKMDISVLISFLEISTIQIRDIIGILESKRYPCDKNEVLKYITAVS
ncbi:MAG: V-type ATPase subunit [Oscillospiraceae bacterium]|nr:V-type ATPase subunit [Oscillospiraceae bacterium]